MSVHIIWMQVLSCAFLWHPVWPENVSRPRFGFPGTRKTWKVSVESWGGALVMRALRLKFYAGWFWSSNFIQHRSITPRMCVISEGALWIGVDMLSAKLLSAMPGMSRETHFSISYTGVRSRVGLWVYVDNILLAQPMSVLTLVCEVWCLPKAMVLGTAIFCQALTACLWLHGLVKSFFSSYWGWSRDLAGH